MKTGALTTLKPPFGVKTGTGRATFFRYCEKMTIMATVLKVREGGYKIQYSVSGINTVCFIITKGEPEGAYEVLVQKQRFYGCPYNKP